MFPKKRPALPQAFFRGIITLAVCCYTCRRTFFVFLSTGPGILLLLRKVNKVVQACPHFQANSVRGRAETGTFYPVINMLKIQAQDLAPNKRYYCSIS